MIVRGVPAIAEVQTGVDAVHSGVIEIGHCDVLTIVRGVADLELYAARFGVRGA